MYNAAEACWRDDLQGRKVMFHASGLRNRYGVLVGVEVAAGRNPVRDEQRTFLTELKAAHNLAFFAHNIAQFQQSYELRGLHAATENSVLAPACKQQNAEAL